MGYLLQDLQVVSCGCREVHEDVHVQRDVRCRCHCHGERLLVACNSMQQPVQQDVMVPPVVRAQTGCTGQPGLRVASTWWGRTWTFPVVSSSYQGGGRGRGRGTTTSAQPKQRLRWNLSTSAARHTLGLVRAWFTPSAPAADCCGSQSAHTCTWPGDVSSKLCTRRLQAVWDSPP